ncbi:MAG: UDP-N-acetylmuramate--L-alanine ligase [Rickettsiales bacterium]|jgi:UDP-N-acetylmuramate--alanine ligase|nr:UDP-N-acetylmuramate--L-alanine ligase [Rickettsiales bacterium]
MKIHFIGINGSGISGVACIAKNKGHDVDGCDIKVDGDYTKQLLKNNIKIECGHKVEHLNDKDLVVITPALLYNKQYEKINEAKFAMDTMPTIKWQKFLGDYITKKQNVVVISGTHGKTTTTTLTALMLENDDKDPTVMVGGEVKEWKQNYRVGNSNWYVLEGDEYDGNFLNYSPRYLLINNLEMEHPECFNGFDDYFNNFKNLIKKIQKNGKIVFNYDDENIVNLINETMDIITKNKIKLTAYTFENAKHLKTTNKSRKNEKIDNDIKIYFVEKGNHLIKIDGEIFEYNLIGEHNIKNITSATITSMECGVRVSAIKKTLKNFNGAKRRLDRIFKDDRTEIYDDYAHHHTQVEITIQALKNILEKNEKIIAILEPHLISRITQNTKEYAKALHLSDYPIITKVYKSREAFMSDVDVKKIINDEKIEYIEDFDDVIERVFKILKEDDKSKFKILVMGAGHSYKLTEKIANFINNKT